MTTKHDNEQPILVIGATGKTGRRVAERLRDRDVPVRIGSRSSATPFDWEDPSTWGAALDGVGAAYISYYPDLAAPGAPEAVRALADAALDRGVRRLVLLSGRGEVEAQRAEQVVFDSGADVTVVRCAWFMQNFSEAFIRDAVLSGEIVLPGGDALEPWVDADDIADVAVAALTEPGPRWRALRADQPAALHDDRHRRRADPCNRARHPVRTGVGRRLCHRSCRPRRPRGARRVSQLSVLGGLRPQRLHRRRCTARPRPSRPRRRHVRRRRRCRRRLGHVRTDPRLTRTITSRNLERNFIMDLKTALLGGGIVTTGLMSGLLYGWSVSVIPGTRRVAATNYVDTMQHINRAIINPAFIIPFMGIPLVLGAAAVMQFRAGDHRRGWLLAGATATYLVGVLGVTVGRNVPLNDALDAFDLRGSTATRSRIAAPPTKRPGTAGTISALPGASLRLRLPPRPHSSPLTRRERLVTNLDVVDVVEEAVADLLVDRHRSHRDNTLFQELDNGAQT